MGHGRHQPTLRELPYALSIAQNWALNTMDSIQIFGPNLHEVDKPEHLNTSSLVLFNRFFKPTSTEQELLFGISWADVRDVAEAHVAALEKEEAGDERIVVSAPAIPNQEFIEAAKRAAGPLGIKSVQIGIRNYAPARTTTAIRFSTAKMDRILGIKITSVDDSIRDTVADFKERGWVPA